MIDSLDQNFFDFSSETRAAIAGAIVGTILGFVLTVLHDLRKSQKEKKQIEKNRAKEQLEKFYAPLLGHLEVNQLLWNDFKEKLLTESERASFKAGGAYANTAEGVLKCILHRKDHKLHDELVDGLNKWVGAMDGVFRYNNQGAEGVILRNLGFLRSEDAMNSDFKNQYKQYLRHVGEFKAVFHRWDKHRHEVQNGRTWYALSNEWPTYRPLIK